MPIDARIPLGGTPVPFNNPFEILQQMQQIKGQQQAIKSAQALEEQRRAQVAAAERKAAEDDEFRRIVSQNLPREQFLDAVRQKSPGNLDAVITRIGEHDEAAAKMEKLSFEVDKARTEWVNGMIDDVGREMNPLVAAAALTEIETRAPSFAPKIQALRQQLSEGGPDALRALVEQYRPKEAKQDFSLSPGQARFDPSGRQIASMPATTPEQKAENFTLSPGSVRFDPTGKQIAAAPAAEKPADAVNLDSAIMAARNNPIELNRLLKLKSQIAAAGREPAGAKDVGPLETIIGPDGKAIRVERKDAIGKQTVAGQEKMSSGVQKRVLNFFNRAKQADEELEGMEAQIQQQSLPGQTWMKYMPNFAQTQLGQSYGAAQRAFTEARLRKDSGAAIPEQEFANDKRTFFAQPGDTQETLEQKRRARAGILASLSFESGQALGEFVGDPEEAKSIVEGYKARSAGKGASAPAAPKKPMTAEELIKKYGG